jgi:primosomal protein N' (replication factor Y)
MASQWIRSVLYRHMPDQRRLTLLGPAEAPVAKIHNRYRWHLLLQAPTSRLMHQWLRAALKEAEQRAGELRSVKLGIDVDPVTFM